MKKQIFAILIMILTLLVFVSCSDGSNPAEETDSETEAETPVLILAENGESVYHIVRAEESEDWERTAAVDFRKYFEELCGFKVELTTDWENKRSETPEPRYEYEILIGRTNRESEKLSADIDALGKRDFIIRTEGSRIFICAKSQNGLNAAISCFFSEYFGVDINRKITASPKLELAADIDYKQVVELKNFDIENMTDLVGICYSTWFNPVLYYCRDKDGDGQLDPPDNTKILAGEMDWGEITEFHYWGKPALGYYMSDDKAVIRTHMTQLADAGIDFIMIDNTNANLAWKNSPSCTSTYWDEMVTKPTVAILDTILEMRAEGLKTPYVVFWCSTGNGWDVVDELYDKYVTDEKYEECWVYWSGLPFFLTTGTPETPNDKITWRMQWGLLPSNKKEQWSFLQANNTPNYGSDGKVEQMCVCTAMQQTYMSLTSTATGREGGRTFWRQWQNAFEYHPKVITVTWWNEWVAQRFEGNMFVDNYNEPYSRDIEPMEGGHGDSYYKWLCEYVRAYKAGEECPELHD